MGKKTNKKAKNRTLPKTGHLITAGVFLVLVFGMASAGIISPDRKFSEMENRSLQQAPEFSFERLKKRRLHQGYRKLYVRSDIYEGSACNIKDRC